MGDLVEVPVVDTVVRLDERRRPEARRRLVETFVATDEARRVIGAVLRRLRAGEGRGFVLGGYGSGKSHLLAILAEAGERVPLSGAAALLGEAGAGAAAPPLAVDASLVAQAAARGLEEILLEAVGEALGRPLAPQPTRPERWREAARAAEESGHAGLLLLVDELSSFLRAKPTRAGLREDVRLLQFLGEQRDWPMCVVATMQETIEAAAQPDPEVSQRLRDRYATLRLSGAHLEEVVAHRLLRHRPGAERTIAAVRARLVEGLGALPCAAERFDRLYPVYPPTLEHLDAMRHHLSAARGALDFVYHRLVGDPDQGVPGLLGESAGTLLTPDALFDHFATRLSETPETAPLVERVGALYRLEGERLFGPGDAVLARRVADYLCVEAAGARPRARTADEVARALAVVEGALDPSLGRAHVAAVLERMVQSGAYVVRADGEGGTRRYRVDQEADAALVVERRLQALSAKAGEAEEGELVDRALALLGDDPALPVETLRRERESLRTIGWERSERRGTVWFGALEELGPEDVEAWLDAIDGPGQDFVLAVAAPSGQAGSARARAHLERLVRAAGDRPGARALLWWLPAPLAGLGPLARLDALAALEGELEAVASESARRALAVVREERRELGPRALRAVVESVYAGEIVLGQGDGLGTPASLRVLSFASVVERLAGSALALRHPDHRAVMARGESVPDSAEEALYAHFLPEGESESGLGPLPLALLDGVLAPLGLAEKRGRGYRLVTDPARSPALAALAGLLAARTAGQGGRGAAEADLADARRELMKGRLGLDRRAVRLTVAAAVFGGLAVPVSGGRRVPLGRITSPDAVDRLEALRAGGPSEGGRVPEALARLPFLAESTDGPYLPAKQRELWARAVKWKAERGDPAAEAEALGDLARHPVLAAWRLEGAVEDLALCGRLAAAIQVSLAPADGLGRLERRSAEEGETVVAAVRSGDAWGAFVRQEVRALLEADRYLAHPALEALAGQGSDWAALAAERQSLRRRLTAAPGLLDAGQRAAWLEDFGRFIDAYRQRYVPSHRTAVGDDPTPALAALDRRWPDAARSPRARAERAAVAARQCTLSPARALDVEPVCPCGYRVGAPPLTQGIAAYADLLSAVAAEGGDTPPAQAEVAAAAPTAVAAPETALPAPKAAAAPRGAGERRRSAAALVASLRADGPVTAAEARRRFERWLAAGGDDEALDIDP